MEYLATAIMINRAADFILSPLRIKENKSAIEDTKEHFTSIRHTRAYCRNESCLISKVNLKNSEIFSSFMDLYQRSNHDEMISELIRTLDDLPQCLLKKGKTSQDFL